MGTRGTVGFYTQGQPKLTYNHFDSYPDGLGVEVFSWLKDKGLLVSDSGEAVLHPEIEGMVHRLKVVDAHAEPTAEELERIGKTYWGEVSSGKDWYAYLRQTQGDLSLILRSGYLIDGGFEFGKDSVFCEWGYVINADEKTLEVYRGFNKDREVTEGLWAGVENPPETTITRADGSTYTYDNYQPVERLLVIPFAEVLTMSPKDFILKADRADADHALATGKYSQEEYDERMTVLQPAQTS